MDVTGLQTLTDEKRQAAVERILRCARLFVAAHGLDVTVEQIADAAGVSRRTLFRLFSTRDELLAAAIGAGLARYAGELPAYCGGDWRAWLHELCRAVHRMNASCGPGFWELATRPNLPPGLSAIEQQRRRGRRAVMTGLADTLWSAANGRGRAPRTLAPAIAAYLSPHFTAAVTDDAGQDWRQAAGQANTAIERLVHHELITRQT